MHLVSLLSVLACLETVGEVFVEEDEQNENGNRHRNVSHIEDGRKENHLTPLRRYDGKVKHVHHLALKNRAFPTPFSEIRLPKCRRFSDRLPLSHGRICLPSC